VERSQPASDSDIPKNTLSGSGYEVRRVGSTIATSLNKKYTYPFHGSKIRTQNLDISNHDMYGLE
jgi:hypothetical protein